jgi:hypothetical protein
MKSRDSREPAKGPVWLEDGEDLISATQLIRFTDQQGREVADAADDADDELGDTVRLPKITRMPEGMQVVEERLGQATAQWILEVRCECGRRWFELEEVATAQCPRCKMQVRVKVE